MLFLIFQLKFTINIYISPVQVFICIWWQPWRASSLRPFGGLEVVPSVEALLANGKNRLMQAIELESGIGRQWCLWKWASYCASEVGVMSCVSSGSIDIFNGPKEKRITPFVIIG